jgi:hypothetical protein
MTVLRREDVQSNVASWATGPYRMPDSPILTIVPLIIRRLRGPSPARITRFAQRPRSVLCGHGRGVGLQRGPQEARQLARDRDRDLRRGLVLLGQASEAPT